MPLGSASSANLAVRADDGRWDYGNIDQVSQMKIGLVTSFSNNAAFRSWCSERGLSPQLVEYESIEDMSTALANGDIDGEVYGAAYGDNSSIRVVLQLAPVDLYYVFRTDDVELKNKVDQAMTQILLEDPYYLSNLNSKYTVQRAIAMTPFTNLEKDYIANHQVVKVAVLSNDEPYHWIDSNGLDAGILPDYFALISQQTGLQFKYIVYDSPSAELAAVKSGEVDAIGLYANGIIFADQDGLLITRSYATTNNVLLARAGTSASGIRSIAINQRSEDVVKSTLIQQFPDAECKTYSSTSDCFEALDSGAADAIVCGFPSATWLMNQTNSSNYSISPLPGASSEFSLAVDSSNRTLCTLLNKGISPTKASYDGIVTSDTLPETNLRSFIEKIPAMWLVLAACILFTLVVALVVMLIQLRQRQKEREAVEAAKAENARKETEIFALEQSAEEKNRFFSNISHDMRTPLNAIIGFSEFAKEADIPPEEKDEYFSKILTSGNLLLDLINDTLTLSKINSSKLELKPAAAYTEEIGAEVTIPIREAAQQKGITFILDKSGYRPRMILVDSLNLEKIFLNLLSNAVKYTPRGGTVWVTISDYPADSSDPDLMFVVRDNGIGISDEFLPHLFEPFATEGRAGSEVTGTGLGLSIVKNLVDLMGGSIAVQSKVDEGTTFTVRLHLPEVREDAGQGGEHLVLGATAQDARAILAGKKVLLCEDNAINAEVAGLMLQKMGMTCDVAINGSEGVSAFEKSAQGAYDAILMDMRMPVMGGIDATRAIRSLERPDAATIPIIALTADAFEEDVQRGREAGMNAHVSKPIDVDVLASVLSGEIQKVRGSSR